MTPSDFISELEGIGIFDFNSCVAVAAAHLYLAENFHRAKTGDGRRVVDLTDAIYFLNECYAEISRRRSVDKKETISGG